MLISTLVEEELREIEVSLFTGRSVELHQSQLDLLMSVDVVTLSLTEDAIDMVGHPTCGVEHLPVAGQLLMLASHLEVVPRVVQLVHRSHSLPPCLLLSHDKIGNQEAVVLLRGRFDDEHLEALARQHGAEIEDLDGRSLLQIEEDGRPFALAFVEPGLAMLGDPGLVRMALESGDGA